MDRIIIRYLDNSATEKEKRLLLTWLEKDRHNRSVFKEMYDLWLCANSTLTDDNDVEQVMACLKRRKSFSRRKRYLAGAAASVILFCFAALSGYLIGEGQKDEVVAMNILFTGEDNKGEYALPDGSTVWLNKNSRLEYPAIFTGGKRTVRLEGEALFEVAKDTSNPFYVLAGGMEVEVTGTRFLVNNYSNKNVVEAILVNGQVKVGGDYFPRPQILQPGQLATYDKQTGQTNVIPVDTGHYTSWTGPKLVFDRTDLAHVIINMEKWFGVEIEASPELMADTRLSFTVRRESLEDILKYLSIISPITFEWRDDVLYLSLNKP